MVSATVAAYWSELYGSTVRNWRLCEVPSDLVTGSLPAAARSVAVTIGASAANLDVMDASSATGSDCCTRG